MEHFCQVHNCNFFRHEKEGKVWYSHKIDTGGYCNEPKEETSKEASPVEKITKSETNPQNDNYLMTKEDWEQRNKIERKSIERQSCLKEAVKLTIADKIKPEQLLPVAAKFESYLENGYKEVQKANKLTEEAVKLGAKVIGKEDSTTK